MEATTTVKKARATKDLIIVRDFVWEKNKHSDGYGWRPALIPQFDPGSPYHAAHDTLEHIDPSDASLEAEMKAFGTYLFLRADGDYWDQKNEWIFSEDPLSRLFMDSSTDPAKHMARDFYSFLDENPHVLAEPPAADPIPNEDEKVITSVLSIGKAGHRTGLSGEAIRSHQNWMERVNRAFGWMRVGFHESEKRYGHLTPVERSSMFIAIEKVVGNITEPLLRILRKGDTMTVTVDTGKREVSVKIVNKDEETVAQMHRKFA